MFGAFYVLLKTSMLLQGQNDVLCFLVKALLFYRFWGFRIWTYVFLGHPLTHLRGFKG